MGDSARELHFLSESRELCFVSGHFRPQDFQGDSFPLEAQVLGFIDLAHASPAKQPYNTEAIGENITCVKNRGRGKVLCEGKGRLRKEVARTFVVFDEPVNFLPKRFVRGTSLAQKRISLTGWTFECVGDEILNAIPGFRVHQKPLS
jgi:hypothetical protein